MPRLFETVETVKNPRSDTRAVREMLLRTEDATDAARLRAHRH